MTTAPGLRLDDAATSRYHLPMARCLPSPTDLADHGACLPGFCGLWRPPQTSAQYHYHLIRHRRGHQNEVLATFGQRHDAEHELVHSETERQCRIVACAGPCDDPEGWR